MTRRVLSILGPATVLSLCEAASACSVCFGEPDSSMVKGAVMGVYVMVGVVGSVLAGVAGTGLFWLQRSRRIIREMDQS